MTKTNYLEDLILKKDFLRLSKVKNDDAFQETLKVLKEEYIDTFTKRRFGHMLGCEEAADLLNHSEAGEVLGKIVMLVHEMEGYKGVMNVINELHWILNDKILDRFEELEEENKQLKELKANAQI